MKDLKVLIVEDLAADVEIARRSLKKEKISFTDRVVDTAENFEKVLVEFKPDLIISDYVMPGFDGMSALETTRSQPHYIPFIILTGSMNEETAVACMKAGADDYVLKEKVRRLPFAVQEVLEKEKARKEKEQAAVELRRSQEKYRLLVQNINDGLMQVDNDDRILFVNKVLCDMFGYTEEELIGKIGYDTLILKEDQKEIEAKNKARLEIPSEKYEIRGKKKNGEIIWLSISGSAVKDEAGNLIGSVGLLTDITDRKKAEGALKHSKRSYEAIFNASTDCIFIHDATTGGIVDVNQTTLNTFGYTKGEITQCDVGDLSQNIPPYTLKEATAFIQKAVEEGPQYFEWLAKKKNDELIWFENSLQFTELAGEHRVLVIGRDISERKQAEGLLRHSETRLREAEKTGKMGHVDWNVAEQRACWSDEIFRIYERDPQLGVPGFEEIMALHQPEDAARLEKAVTDALQKGTDYDLDLVAVMPSGRQKYLHILGKPVTDNNGIVTNIRGTVQDITERKQANNEIREMKNRYQSLFENSMIGIGLATPEGKIIESNKAFADMLGYSKPDLEKSGLITFYKNPDDRKSIVRLMQQNNTIKDFETRLIRKDGFVIDVLLNISLITIRGETYYQTSCQDITARKQAENERERTNSVLQQLLEVANELTTVENENDVIRIIKLAARRLSGADGVTIVLRDGDKCHYVDEDAIAPLWKGKRFPMDSCISGWVMHNKENAIIEDIFVDPRIPHEIYRKTFVKSLAMNPIRTKDPIGAIGVYWKDTHRVTESEIALLAALCDMTNSIWDSIESRNSLRESEEKFRRITNNMTDVVWTTDLDFHTTYISPSIYQLTGYTVEEYLKMDLDKKHLPTTLIRFQKLLAQEMQTENSPDADKNKTMVIEGEHYKSDGTIITISMHVSFIRDRNGNPIGIQGVTRDITQRKKAEEALKNKIDELERFHKLTVDREFTMIELKKEINEMLEKNGKPAKYKIVECQKE